MVCSLANSNAIPTGMYLLAPPGVGLLDIDGTSVAATHAGAAPLDRRCVKEACEGLQEGVNALLLAVAVRSRQGQACASQVHMKVGAHAGRGSGCALTA
jgi:hypothetical protein